MKPEHTVQELAAHVEGTVVGNASVRIVGLASLDRATARDITYVEDARFFEAASASRAGCVIVPREAAVAAPCRIEVSKPKLAFAKIGEVLQPPASHPPVIHATAIIGPGAVLSPTVSIGPHASIGAGTSIGDRTHVSACVVIGDEVTIGSDCVIHPGVVIYDRVTLGNRVIVHANACIGADGFGYVRDGGVYRKFPQAGTVLIEDDVELGAGVCVDRGSLVPTRIGRGTKLDNLVHVGHNANLGERIVIAAQTGISGSVVIEDDVVIGGQVGLGDHAHVRRGSMIGSKAGVLPGKILRAGQWWGVPVQRLRAYKRLNAHWHRLPLLHAELRELRRRMEAVQSWISKNGKSPS